MSVRRFDNYRWQKVDVLAYKEAGAHFRDVTRQVLFGEDLGLSGQLRYFELGPGGHSTLERHRHAHGVLVFRGAGRVLVGDRVADVGVGDLVSIPTMTWHQFRATGQDPLGFLCLVDCERDRPQLPTQEDLALLRRDPEVAAFIRC